MPRRSKLPKATCSKYKKIMARKAVKLFMEGKSITQVAAALKVSTDSLERWRKDPRKPEFAEAMKLGLTYAEAYHEQLLLDIANGTSKGSAAAAIFIGKNRYHWKDVSTIENLPEEKTLSTEELDARIASLEGGKVVSINNSK